MINFTRIAGTSLYGRTDQGDGPGWMAFLATDTTGGLPETLSLADAWSGTAGPGYLCFTRQVPGDGAAFAAALAAFRDSHPDVLPEPAHTSFAWLVVTAGSNTVESASVLPVRPGDGNPPQVATHVVFNFANYGIPFEAGTRVQTMPPNGDVERFLIAFPVDLPGAGVTGGAAGVFLPLDGNGRYALASQALIADYSDDPRTGWDASIRYAYRDDESPIGMRIQRYPVFAAGSAGETSRQVLFDTQWDPLAPLDPDRTFLAFTGQAYDLTITERGEIAKGHITPADNVLASNLRTVFGRPLALCPGESAKLVFQPLPTPEGEKYYLTPQGEFAVVDPAGGGAETDVLCGLAGSEFIRLRTDGTGENADRLRFQASNKALAPVFPLLGAQGAAGLPLLEDGFLTAWVKPVAAPDGGSSEPVYFAQPREAGLFKPGDAGQGVLGAFHAPAARFVDAEADAFFPMAFYAGLDDGSSGFPGNDIAPFESQILNPARRASIAALDPGPQKRQAEASPQTTTTPQGFLATIDDLSWKKVLLARDPEGGPDLAFLDLGDTLRQALQSNELFLVASRAEPLGDFRNRVNLAGWPFTVDPSVNGDARRDFRNVLVFKFGAGTVRERVRDTSAWTDAAAFNADPLSVADWIQRYIAETEQAVEENPRFRKFLDIVDNPAWNGVLMLRVDVGLDDFPQDLKGLLAGIEQENFFGHHLGINVNFVEQSGPEGLEVPKSALFGLIAYQDRELRSREAEKAVRARPRTLTILDPPVQAPEAGEGRYDFRVLNLQVVFENSDIVDFESLITLTTDSWFLEPARVQTGTPLNSVLQFAVELSGSYENQDGHRTYTFNTLPDTSYRFILESHTLDAVDIVKAQFHTIDVRDLDQNVERIASRFTFWALLEFKPLAGFDAYSFGGSPGGAGRPKGLFLSNLNVNMTFDFNLPNRSASNRVFTFSIDDLALDPGQSDVRTNSLAANFPVTVSNLIRGGRGTTPDDLGFIEIQAPAAFDVTPLGDSWFGLVFDLNLGSLGALAEDAGFKASVLAAWSPDPERRSGALLIKLPLLGGGKQTFSLQNVLKLSIGTIAFETDDSVPDQLAYILRFSTIALKFLGISLPPGAETNALLFGNPAEPGSGANLGWYAAYIDEDKNPAVIEER